MSIASLTPMRPTEAETKRGHLIGLSMFVTPMILIVVLIALWLWVHNQALDSIESRTLEPQLIWQAVREHLTLALSATLIATSIAVPVAILISRPRFTWAAPLVSTLANLGQAVPGVGTLILLSVIFGLGFKIALVALVASSILPILRNTLAGLKQVDPALIEAGHGMGLTALPLLLRIQLRLALPVVIAGIRNATVHNIGVTTLAALVAAGGLGNLIITGIKLQRWPVLVVGAVLVSVAALLFDWLGGVLERLTSRHMD